MASSEHCINFPLVGMSLLLKRNVVLRHVTRLTPPKYSVLLTILWKFTVLPSGRHNFDDSLQKLRVILTVKQLKSDSVFALIGRFAAESYSGIY